MYTSFSYKAPGSAMIMGEHAVLRGYPAIVAALDVLITATVTLRQDDKVILTSKEFGSYETTLDNITIKKPWQFALSAVAQVKKQLKQGITVTIESTLSHEQGLGTSAAVTVATLGALWKATGIALDKKQLLITARNIIREVQGLGSGADVAASVYGGILYYQSEPLTVQVLANHLPFYLVYSGKKVPTVEVVSQVNAKEKKSADGLQSLWQAMGDCTERGKKAIDTKNWCQLGKLCDEYQTYMVELGVSNHKLDTLCQDLRFQPKVYGAKISGSGLGDSVLAITAV